MWGSLQRKPAGAVISVQSLTVRRPTGTSMPGAGSPCQCQGLQILAVPPGGSPNTEAMFGSAARQSPHRAGARLACPRRSEITGTCIPACYPRLMERARQIGAQIRNAGAAEQRGTNEGQRMPAVTEKPHHARRCRSLPRKGGKKLQWEGSRRSSTGKQYLRTC